MVDNNEVNAKNCICPTCPTWPNEGVLFCARGKSSKNPIAKGCECPNCLVWSQYTLSSQYYCLKGSAV